MVKPIVPNRPPIAKLPFVTCFLFITTTIIVISIAIPTIFIGIPIKSPGPSLLSNNFKTDRKIKIKYPCFKPNNNAPSNTGTIEKSIFKKLAPGKIGNCGKIINTNEIADSNATIVKRRVLFITPKILQH
jgi:hypothetical protein